MSSAADAFVGPLVLLARARVEFVVVGVCGINFYARDASEVVVTGDVDVLLRPSSAALGAALRALSAAGFRFEAGHEPFQDVDDERVLARVCELGASIGGGDAEGVRVDLMTSMSGFGFAELAADAVAFRIQEVEVRVGRLEKLLRSKELSGRRKDVEFLRMFAARLEDDGA